MTAAEKYYDAYQDLGSYAEVARKFDCNISTVWRAVRRHTAKLSADPVIQNAMDTHGLSTPPRGAWVKTSEPDADGNTYSFFISGPNRDELDTVDRTDTIREIMTNIPAVKLPKPKSKPQTKGIRALIPMNDIHAGGYSWSEETGYGDWDLKIATTRLIDWSGRLLDAMPVVDECILFYNGDTLHANGKVPMTPASGHVLDTDTRFFKAVDMTAAAMVVVADMAAQKHKKVRVVIKRGNHDEDSYIALLMAMKYRYQSQSNVTVEEDPSPYWAYGFGKVFLYGHHGDRVKADQLVLKMGADHREALAHVKYSYVWTAHLHKKEVDTVYGTIVERASCITEPDAYGAGWGASAAMTAVLYDPDKGEVGRYTVRS